MSFGDKASIEFPSFTGDSSASASAGGRTAFGIGEWSGPTSVLMLGGVVELKCAALWYCIKFRLLCTISPSWCAGSNCAVWGVRTSRSIATRIGHRGGRRKYGRRV